MSYVCYFIVGTAFLWWTFISNKSKLDREEQMNIPLLEVDINSEYAFMSFSGSATGLTVSKHCIYLYKKLNHQE